MFKRKAAMLAALTALCAPVLVASAPQAGAAGTYSCTASSVDNPHYSSNSGSVIAKVRVRCTSSNMSGYVSLQVLGSLYRLSGGKCGTPGQGPGVRVYYSWLHDGTVNDPIEFGVSLNSANYKTLYIPIEGSPSKFTLNATYYATARIYQSSNDLFLNEEYSHYEFTGPACP